MRTAAYARYSSDLQREASIEDQLRNVRGYCARQGWPAPEVFTDSALSGSRLDRPGYQQFLAQAHRFDVLLVDDLTRFGRDKDEIGRTVKRLNFHGIRLVGVSDGVDTTRKSSKLDVGMRGLIAELFLDDLAEKTHRGLTGRALAGASAGGLPYGYRVTEKGQRAIREDQAAVVRRIFDEYVAGASPRTIAAGLNRDRVPSSRGSTWAMTAIHPDVRRGIGILCNAIYVGDQVWNRSRWVKHPETGRRVRQERPQADWIVQHLPELAIVDRATWDAAQRRAGGHARGGEQQRGRPPVHLLSGLLRCGECGGPMVVIDRYRYGCARAKDRGTCASRVRFDRVHAENVLMAGVRSELLGEEAFRRFQREAEAVMRRAAPDLDRMKRELQAAEVVRENVLAAIRAGILTSSTKAELVRAEAAVGAAAAAFARAQAMQPTKIVPRAREVWNRIVADMTGLARGKPAARAALRTIVGDEIVVRTNENGDPIAEVAGSMRQINVVAGAGSVPYLAGPLVIPLTAGRES